MRDYTARKSRDSSKEVTLFLIVLIGKSLLTWLGFCISNNKCQIFQMK